MLFVRPLALWLLLAIVPLLIVQVRRQRTGLRLRRVAVVAALRSAAFGLLVVALARPVIERPDGTRTVVAVVDTSASVDDEALLDVQRRIVDEAARLSAAQVGKLVVFDRQARLIDADGFRLQRDRLAQLRGASQTGEGQAPGSALAAALELAGGLIPHDGRGRVLLYTDGLETGGDALAAADRLARRGIGVTVTPIGRQRTDEVVLQSVALPPYARVGSTVELRAEVESSLAGPARLVVQPGDAEPAIVTPVLLSVGRQTIAGACPLNREGLSRFGVTIEAAGDRLADNNTLTAAIEVGPPLDVNVLEDSPGAPATQALAALLGASARVRTITPAALSSPDAWRNADVLVVADVPAERIDPDVQRAMRDAVAGGLGLLATGGRRSFGPGGYADTPLAEVLPVRCTQEVERRDPSATLVVIIDTSGSMGGERVSLAKEVARLALARLKPHDKAGIVEFYGSKRWAAPIQPASNAIDLQRALNRLSSGGGTVILPAIEEAYYALLNVRTRTRHVLVLTDGGVEPGAFEPLIRQMAEKGITLSTVLVGPGLHSAFLADLAQWGRGRSYSAPDRFNLPEIITKQPESSLLAPLVEKPSAVVKQRDDAILRGVDLAAAPPIAGYVQTEARPTADVVLASEIGHPLLARWRYGLGEVAALTTQMGGEWSGELSQWRPWATVAANLVRSLSRPNVAETLRITPIQRPGAVEVDIVRRADGPGAADAGLAAVELTATDEAGATRSWVLDPIQPSRWNTRLAGFAPGVYRLQARVIPPAGGPEVAGRAAATVAAAREVTSIEPDGKLLDAIAALRSTAEQRAGQVAPPTRAVEAWPALVGAALVLFLLNVLARRWPEDTARGIRRLASAALAAALVVGMAAGAAEAAAPSATAPIAAAANLPEDAAKAIDQALTGESAEKAAELFAAACTQVERRDGDLSAVVAFLRERADTNPSAARLLAEAARRNGELSLARDTLAALVERRPADATAWGELARVEESLGNGNAALAALERALGAEQDADRRAALYIRRALLAYDAGDRGAAGAALRAVVAERSEFAAYAGHLAVLCGDNDLALELAKPTAGGSFSEHLFQGLRLLRADRAEAAGVEFEEAFARAPLARDRRYAVERQVAAARRAGRLSELADQWLADGQLPAERLGSLVAILRELGRSEEALRLLTRPSPTPEQQEVLESAEFQHELIAVAVEAGKEGEAEAAYRAMLARHPERVEWRSGLARLLLLDERREAAIELFNEAIAQFDQPRGQMALADAARQLALDEVALAAAGKAGAQGGAAEAHAVLFEADLARQRGQTDQAIALLHKLAAGAEKVAARDATAADNGVLLLTAEAFERYGDKAEALRLFRLLNERSGGEDVLLRLAWLLEENGRLEEAYGLWKQMWDRTQAPARLRQAQERLLDLASRTGRLADLAVELEERLEQGQATDRELSLLVEIYTTANDPASAAEILQEFGKRSGREVDALQRLARVYLSCEQFGRCNAVLRRLAKIDPANAEDYLNQIAVVALERKRPQEAKAVLAELAAVTGQEATVGEFSAGVLAMMGLNDEAARCYGRLLAENPDRVEALLLWGNAMKAAGQADRAVAVFQNVVEEAAEDDLFAVAIDGLLNLDAKPMVLRSALRRVYARIAAKPEKVFLYQLAADVLEAIGGRREMNDVLEAAVVVAGERRGPLLRELMDSAKADGQNDRVIYFGRSLVALGEEMPPQVFLDLGEALIREGDLTLAERVFDRASVGADYVAVEQRVATYYEEAGMPAAAERIIRELLTTEPDNVPLLIRAGDLRGQIGRFDRALEGYQQAVDLLLRRMPAVVRADELATQPKRKEKPTAPARGAANLDELAQFFDNATCGLLEAARSAAQREQLLAEWPRRVDQEIEALRSSGSVASVLQGNSRLDRLAALVRHVAFALHQPDIADQMDEKLVQLYPGDAALREQIVQSRVAWELYGRANRWAAAAEDASLPVELRIARMLKDPAQLEAALTGGKIDQATTARLAPLLIMTGQDEAARRVLRVVAPGAEAEAIASAASLVTAAVAVDDHEAVVRWMEVWLEAARKAKGGKQTAEQTAECIRRTWNYLTAAEQAGVVNRLERLAASLEGGERVRVDLLRLRLSQGLGTPLADLERVLKEAADEPTVSAEELAGLLEQAPADGRGALLERAVAARKPATVRSFLMELVGRLGPLPGSELADTVESLFKSAPVQRAEAGRTYTTLTTGRWNRNRHQAELGRRIGEILLSAAPNDPFVLVAAAVARENAGRQEEAMLLVQDALDKLLAVKQPEFEQRRMVDDLARLMRPADVDRVLGDLEERADIEGETPTLLLAKGVLLEVADRPADTIAAYRRAFELAPNNRIISRALITTLQNSGRQVELARLLAANLTKATVMESFEWRTLTTLYCNLFDPRAAARTARKDETPLGPIQSMYISRMMGREDEVCATFRRIMINRRSQGRFYDPFWPEAPAAGGMVEYLAKQEAGRRERTNAFAALADMPFAESEYAALLTAATPDRRDVPGLVGGLVKAGRQNGTTGPLAAELVDAARREALTGKDRRLIVVLAEKDSSALPEGLGGATADVLTYADPTDQETLSALARIAQARGDGAQAARIWRWLIAHDLRDGRRPTRLDDHLARIDLYVAEAPEADRDGLRRRLWSRLDPTPLDELSDDLDARMLERWAEVGDAGERDRRAERFRRMLAEAPITARFKALPAALARADAVAGRNAEYLARVEAILDAFDREFVSLGPVDTRSLLPKAARLTDPAAYARMVGDALEARRGAGRLERREAVESLGLLGAWWTDNGRADAGRETAEQAEAGAGELGGHWLWIADLARSAGDEGKATAIEQRLLEADMLPVVRVPALLEAVEARSGPAVADQLATRVVGYSDHPAVLRRAQRSAEGRGDTGAARAYADRLRALTPPE